MALNTLFQYLKRLRHYRRQFLDPIKHSDCRVRDLRGAIDFLDVRERLNFRELSFLAYTDDADLLNRLDVREMGYHSVADTIRHFNKIRTSHVEPAIETVSGMGVPLTCEALMNSLGERIFYSAQGLADHIFEDVDREIAELRKIIKELREALKAAFPEARFLNYSLAD